MVSSLALSVVHRSRFFSQWHRTPFAPRWRGNSLAQRSAAPPSRLQAPPSPSPPTPPPTAFARVSPAGLYQPSFLPLSLAGWSLPRSPTPAVVGRGEGTEESGARGGFAPPSPARALERSRRRQRAEVICARMESRWASGTTLTQPSTHPPHSDRSSFQLGSARRISVALQRARRMHGRFGNP